MTGEYVIENYTWTNCNAMLLASRQALRLGIQG